MSVGASPLGASASAEVGARVLENLSVYGVARASARFGSPIDAYVGAGARLRW